MNTKDYKLPASEIIKSKATIDFTTPDPVALYPLISSKEFQQYDMKIPLILGIDKSNGVVIEDLTEMPHLLVGGDLPCGKSSFLRNVIISLLYKKHPDELKLVLVDTSNKEFASINGLGSTYLARLTGEEESIVSDSKTCIRTLNSLIIEMNLRYQKLSTSRCSNLEDFNSRHPDGKIPYLIVILDEFAGIKSEFGNEFDRPIFHLAQKGRGVGIHLILSTNKMRHEILNVFYDVNFTSRLTFRTSDIRSSLMTTYTWDACLLDAPGEAVYRTLKKISPTLRTPYVASDSNEVANTLGYIGAQHLDIKPYLLPEGNVKPCELPTPLEMRLELLRRQNTDD